MELGVLYWGLPLLAVVGGGLLAFGIVDLAGDVVDDGDRVGRVVDGLGWRDLKHYID